MTSSVLGLNLSYASSCALVSDGKIKAAVSEERFTRKKNEESCPIQSIRYCRRIDPSVEHVYVASLEQDILHRLTKFYSTFDVQDRVREQREFWIPQLIHGEEKEWLSVFEGKVNLTQFPGNWGEYLENRKKIPSDGMSAFDREWLTQMLSKELEFDKEKIIFLEHHSVHASYARSVFLDVAKEANTGIIVLDAYGDGTSASVWKNYDNDHSKLRCLFRVEHKDFQLARIYRYVTLILGMLPDQHEYKVMGLAPYNTSKYSMEVRRILEEFNWVSGLNFEFNSACVELYQTLLSRLEGYRFDQIAAGLQDFSENLIINWVKNIVKEFGFDKLIFSGGVAANIKALKVVRDNLNLKQVLVPPAPGDESLGIGAAAQGYAMLTGYSAHLETIYLGPRPNSLESPKQETEKSLLQVNKKILTKELEKIKNPRPEKIAEILASGLVLGRCCGAMEFGPRALGNRSILADPRNYSVVQRINDKIKNRDFWMPFAPIILAKYADSYLENSDEMAGAYMTLAFNTIEKEKISAGVHPKDNTSRPQILQSFQNPELHELIKQFGDLTGVYSLLNTSFNLHGEPIVCSEADACRVFLLSGLDGLILEDELLLKI